MTKIGEWLPWEATEGMPLEKLCQERRRILDAMPDAPMFRRDPPETTDLFADNIGQGGVDPIHKEAMLATFSGMCMLEIACLLALAREDDWWDQLGDWAHYHHPHIEREHTWDRVLGLASVWTDMTVALAPGGRVVGKILRTYRANLDGNAGRIEVETHVELP